MKSILAPGFFLIISLIQSACQVQAQHDPSLKPVSHDAWTQLLRRHVTASGMVDYQGFIRDSSALNQYLSTLEGTYPNAQHWSREERLAYWINAYNAYTVQLIIRHYPVESIKDIKEALVKIPLVNTVWDLKFITIDGENMDLNHIEHGILRKEFEEPRIHFAINCASFSCPKMRPEAFTALKLEGQLQDAALDFINDPKRNRLGQEQVELSKIFSWFSGDFKDEAGSVLNYIRRFAQTPVSEDADVDYMDYDWRLNDAGTRAQ